MSGDIDRVLATLPRATPVLTGRDARRFIAAMRNPKPISREEYLRAKQIYDSVFRNTESRTHPAPGAVS